LYVESKFGSFSVIAAVCWKRVELAMPDPGNVAAPHGALARVTIAAR